MLRRPKCSLSTVTAVTVDRKIWRHLCVIYVYLSKSYDLNCHDFNPIGALGPVLFRVPRAVIGPILAPSEGQEERKEMDDVEVDEATTDQDTLKKVSKHVKHVMFPKKRVWKFEMF